MIKRTPLLTALLLATIPLASFTPAVQDANSKPQGQLLSREDCQVYYFTAEHRYADDLFGTAADLFGRLIPAYDADGNLASFTENIHTVDDKRLLIFDTPKNAERILALLKELDVPYADDDFGVQTEATLSLQKYMPRYLTPDDVLSALQPFARDYVTAEGMLQSNLSMLNHSGLILIRDTVDKCEAMLAFLSDVDRPLPQVELTCYVLRGADAPVDNALPQELTDNLARLVPFKGFELASMGVVRTSVGGQGGITIEMPGMDEQFTLDATVSAFDAQNEDREVLTMRTCQVRQQLTLANGGGSRQSTRTLFSTSASIANGEYAVMGATGNDPVFVVLRFERVGR